MQAMIAPGTEATASKRKGNPAVKRGVIRFQLLTLGHCYSAAPADSPVSLDALEPMTIAYPSRRLAMRAARRKAQASGEEWTIVKWGRR